MFCWKSRDSTDNLKPHNSDSCPQFIINVFEESKYHAKHAGDSLSHREIFLFQIMNQKAKQQEMEKKRKEKTAVGNEAENMMGKKREN